MGASRGYSGNLSESIEMGDPWGLNGRETSSADVSPISEMQGQKEHDKPESLVESPHQEEKEARTLQDEVASHNSLEGYFAMNNVRDGEEKKADELADEQEKLRESAKPGND